MVAQEAVDPVVAQRQIQHRVVRRPADVRPRARRGQLHRQHPPTGRGDERGHRTEQMKHTLGPGRRRDKQVGKAEAGQHQEALQHLGEKRGAHDDADEHQPAPRCGHRRAHQAVGGHRQQQHQQRVGVVEAEHQRRRGRTRQHRTGQQSRGRTVVGVRERASHRAIQHGDGRNAHQRLRRHHRPTVHAEQAHRQPGHPQRGGRLVDGDEVLRVERPEEPRRPALRTGLRGRGVEGVAVPAGRQVPQVQDGRRHQ